MKQREINGITWYIEDEGLAEVVRDVSEQGKTRRGYGVHPYKDGKVFIKYFHEKGMAGYVRNIAAPRGKKEYFTAKRLLCLSVPTPEPLGYGLSATGSYAIQKWVDAPSFARMFAEGEKARLLPQLALLLNTLTRHHVRHNDLHLENILVTAEGLCLIDLHKMQIKKAFRLADEVSNLSHALVSLYNDLREEEKEAFFESYGSSKPRPRLEAELHRLVARWFQKKQERAFTGNSKVSVSGDRLYVNGREGSAVGSLVETIKTDKKVRVERWSDHIRKIFRDERRLRKAWKAHVVFLYLDIPAVPQPYYCLMPSKGQEGYIAMEDLKGRGQELDRYLDTHYDDMSYRERKVFIDRMALFFDGLFKWGIMHNDLKGCNLFVLGGRDFVLLDVEDFAFAALHMEGLKKMFLQLTTTLPKRIVMRDRMRFFLRITSTLNLDRRGLFRTLLWKTAGKEIVYEGKSGLMRESW
ncbi:MAG TPA: lipopolysaccharide kinase InaA family protein [Syntrophorhabdaceae bacterium]|jgi:tRNA A-37 threonylcarbamoyl transferase component Bud32